MTFQLLVFALNKEIFAGEAKSATVPGATGQLQVLANHTPVITQLVEGDISIEAADGKEVKLPIMGGVLEVKEKEVVILANV